MNKSFWKNKNVLITGHTGFKGTWLSLWLDSMGAKVSGFSLKPNKNQFFYRSVQKKISFKYNIYGDIRNKVALNKAISRIKPQIIIHLAAQPLVSVSYSDPVKNYEININGTLNILDSIKKNRSIKVLLNVTTDKCYKNNEKNISFVECDPLGGLDPYSSSKACSELITAAYYNSFFKGKIGIATARAGNVIGGGDWSDDRLIPDLVKVLQNNNKIKLRNPKAKRPWQHVFEPLRGYILLCEKLYSKPELYSEGWNFGPKIESNVSVEKVVNLVSKECQQNIIIIHQKKEKFYESKLLMLNSKKSLNKLKWIPKLDINESIKLTMDWYNAWFKKYQLYEYSLSQIKEYEKK